MHTIPHRHLQPQKPLNLVHAVCRPALPSDGPKIALRLAMKLPGLAGGQLVALEKSTLRTRLALLSAANLVALKLEAQLGALAIDVYVPLVRGDKAIDGLRRGAMVTLDLTLPVVTPRTSRTLQLRAVLNRSYCFDALPSAAASPDIAEIQTAAIIDFIGRPFARCTRLTDGVGVLPSFARETPTVERRPHASTTTGERLRTKTGTTSEIQPRSPAVQRQTTARRPCASTTQRNQAS